MCGLVGIVSKKSAVSGLLYESLVQLQHRGQDAAGILTGDDKLHCQRGAGLVRDVFTAESLSELKGRMGIGHVRYPTAGSKGAEMAQPFWTKSVYGIGLAHNGNLTNPRALGTELARTRQRYFSTDSDSEVLLELFADGFQNQSTTDDPAVFFEQVCQAVAWVFQKARGAYSVVSLVNGKGLIAFRDPLGIRPLVIGQNEEATIIASETSPFFCLGFTPQGDILPGEVVFVHHSGQVFRKRLETQSFHPCVFEYVYFARPDSLLNDVSVYRARLRMGQNCAKQWREEYPDLLPDVVIPVPFSANTAALSFAHELGVRYSEGLYKNPFIGRTFIMPNQPLRKRSVRHKLSPQSTEIRDKIVLLLDDSIVRGTTSKEIVKMVREAGAKAVYLVSACPPIRFPCYYGIDIPTSEELIAANRSLEEVKEYLGVDALLYQTESDLKEAVMRKGEHHIDNPCMACLNGCYMAPKGELS